MKIPASFARSELVELAVTVTTARILVRNESMDAMSIK